MRERSGTFALDPTLRHFQFTAEDSRQGATGRQINWHDRAYDRGGACSVYHSNDGLVVRSFRTPADVPPRCAVHLPLGVPRFLAVFNQRPCADRDQHGCRDRRRRVRDVWDSGGIFPWAVQCPLSIHGHCRQQGIRCRCIGGIAPFIAAALLAWSQGAYWPIATYIALLAGISFVATFFAPETRGISLRQ